MKKRNLLFKSIVVAGLLTGCGKKNEVSELKEEEKVVETPKIKIIDTESKTRPYAVSINNTPVAVKVQEGVNKAYLVYEIPTEGFTSRLLAFYKDPEDITLGTIRSARHNFMDYAHESDAIFVCFGWSHYAQDELKKGGTDYLKGSELNINITNLIRFPIDVCLNLWNTFFEHTDDLMVFYNYYVILIYNIETIP